MIFAGGFSDFERLQKAEQKEKEKKQRERQKSIEIQRDRAHRAACEDAAAKLLEIAAQPSLKPKHRHSVHASTVQHLHITQEQMEKLTIDNHHHEKHKNGVNGPQRSTSSEHCREKKDSVGSSNPNKFLRWLGLAGKESDKEPSVDFKELKKRRMSTFT
ncbi:unnamed protein product [Auanema sp. JU1783]|nr:unnamed protein product [Auanema sp. JU1783]